MYENLNTILISGGKAHCTPAWDRKTDEQDRCFKIYFLVSGSARLSASGKRWSLSSRRLYLIDGNRLQAMECAAAMDVYWMHFMPESLYLEQVLSALPAVVEIKPENAGAMGKRWKEAVRIFEQSVHGGSTQKDPVPLALSCAVESLILDILSRAIKASPHSEDSKTLSAVYRFREVINFMDTHYKENPSLPDLAQKAGMAPEYFHRQFRDVFNTTPYEYMLRRRMNMAQNLIRKTGLSIKEVAQQCGYENPFYFSRIFAKWLKISPSVYRQQGARM